MPTKLIEAYDTKTGAKLPQRVPETWLDIFPHLSLTPKSKARGTTGASTSTKKEA